MQSVTNAFKSVKKSVQEKWSDFMKKFETTKVEILHEVINAKTPEELVVLGKKLQEEGKALEAEESSIKSEELKEKAHEEEVRVAEAKKAEKLRLEAEATTKAAEEERLRVEAEAKAKAEEAERLRLAQEARIKLEEIERKKLEEEERAELAKLAIIRAKMNDKKTESNESLEVERIKAENITMGMVEGEQPEEIKFKNKSIDSSESKKVGAVNNITLEYGRINPVEFDNKSVETFPEKREKVLENFLPKDRGVKSTESNIDKISASKNEEGQNTNSVTSDEIKIAAKNIAKSDDGAEMLIFLGNFKNKNELIIQPEVIEAFKRSLSEGMHLYDIDRLVGMPGVPEEIFNDPAVQRGIQSSLKSFVTHQSEAEWSSVSGAVDRVVAGAKISDGGLRNIAEEIKGNSDAFRIFIGHFGSKRVYPELNQ